jgi:hypothetical protein
LVVYKMIFIIIGSMAKPFFWAGVELNYFESNI